MEKKESPNNPAPAGGGHSKIAALTGRLFSITKFVMGICLLAVVYAVSVSLVNEITVINEKLQVYFWAGALSFVFIYLFVWEPAIIYAKGQKVVEMVFSFFKPLVRVAPFVLPIYTILLFALYGILCLFNKPEDIITWFIFLFGFSISLHLVFSAKSLRSRQGDLLKANYIFGFSLVYIIDLSLLAFGLNLIFKEFSCVRFFNSASEISGSIFYAVFKQLFLPA